MSDFNKERQERLIKQKEKDHLSSVKKNKENVKKIINSFFDKHEKENITVGWKPKSEEKRTVGERWQDENGKWWTQYNGYRMADSKVMGEGRMPFSCPVCSNPLNHRVDKYMYRINGKCMECVAKEETEMAINGTYREYELNKIKENMRSHIKLRINELEDFVTAISSGDYVDSFGNIERWGKLNPEDVKNDIIKDIDNLKQEFESLWNESIDKIPSNLENNK